MLARPGTGSTLGFANLYVQMVVSRCDPQLLPHERPSPGSDRAPASAGF